MKINAIILGPIGAGKTWSLRTLLPEYPDASGRIRKGAGLSVRLLALEPGWEATNGDLTCDMGWHVIQHLPATIPWDSAREWAERIGNMTMEAVARMEVSTMIRQDYQQFVGLYVHSSHFVCERCGIDFGPADAWDDTCAYVNDGLTGISKMGMHLVAGPKPILSQPQYGSSMAAVEAYIDKCVGIRASYVLVAHWAREPDEVEGGSRITVDTIGNKLAPRLVKKFDEIILARREKTTYTWSTDDQRIDLKVRRLPYSDKIDPSFAQIFGT